MKRTKEKADELVESHLQALIDNHNWDAMVGDGVKCAILSVKHTIESLNMCNVHEVVDNEIKRQSELLTELDSRL